MVFQYYQCGDFLVHCDVPAMFQWFRGCALVFQYYQCDNFLVYWRCYGDFMLMFRLCFDDVPVMFRRCSARSKKVKLPDPN